MTSAFFALKKGAGIGGMNMSKEQTAKKERFLREVERQLLRKGLDSEMTEGGILNVKWHGQLLCDVDGDGVVCFPSKTVRGVDADASLQTVIQIASQVREYMPIFARAPALKAIGLEGSYKILADFGDAVLAGRLGKKGANFVTWEWDFDRNGVHMGHYFIEDYRRFMNTTGTASAAIALMSAGRHKCHRWKSTVRTMSAALHCFGKTRRFPLPLMKAPFQIVMHGLTHWKMSDCFVPL